MSVTLLTAYYTTANSAVLTSAELLVTSVGTPTTFAGGSTVDSSTGWYQVGLGAASTTFYGSIQDPTGIGALLDVSSLQGNALLAGSYSASMQFSLSQASTSMSGSMVLRYYKYNIITKTYTPIGTITNSSVNINSTSAVTVTWDATQFNSVYFDFGEYLYVDIWFHVVTNTMTTGGQFQLIIPNSSTQGIATEYFATPGYDSSLSPHQLAYDNFTRANQSGWGTAYDVLHSWTARDATATYSILSNQGKILQNSTSVDEINTLFSPPSNTAYEIFGVCTTSNATSHPGLAVNFQSTGNMIKCEISPTATNLIRYISGSQTTLKADTGTKVTTSNATYNFRFRWEVGGTYYFKCWIGTTTEPAAWNANAISDTTYNSGAVGIYLAPRGATTDTCLWSQFYVTYSDLNENTVINGISLNDASSTITVNPVPTDALSAPTDLQAWVVNSASTDNLTEIESSVLTLSDTFPVDSNTQTDASAATITQNQSDVLSAPVDSQAWVEAFTLIDVLAEIDSTTFALSDTFAVDSLTPSDTTTPTNNPSLSEALFEAETAAYIIAESTPVDAVSNAESAAYIVAESTTDSLSDVESSSYTASQTYPSEILSVTEIDALAQYYSIQESLTTSDTQLEAIVELPASDNTTLIEITVTKVTDLFPSDSVTEQEITLTQVIQTDATTIGTTDDSIVFGQPGVILPDQLTITETISFANGRPLVDVGLIPSDSLDWDTNFIDHCHIVESIEFDYSSTLLDARSILYTNIISDGPSAYYQLNEGTFAGLYQRDGSDQPNNASVPVLYGAMLEYTWAQIEPDETDRIFSTIDADILPWRIQQKKVILRVVVSSTPAYNNAHNVNSAGQATPQWVFDAGAPSVTGLDGAVYPVYWDSTFLAKYQNFVESFANYYDEDSTVAGIVISCGVNGTTALEASGDTQGNTLSLWTPRGYTPAQWMEGITDIINVYQSAFQHTPLILSVNDAVIAPDNVYNIHQCVSIAVAQAAWLMDENVFINEQHNDPNWNIVPLVTVPRHSVASGLTPDTLDGGLTLAVNYQADYAAVWAADITASNISSVLSKYFDLAQTKGLNDSATSNFKMSIFGGVYPTSHISTGDYLNGAQQFDGLTGYGYIGQLAQENTDAWTLKCTIFPTVLPVSESIAFNVGNDGYNNYGGYALGISGGANGGPGAKFCAHLPGIGWIDSGYSFPKPGQWYQLFATFDGVTLRFYANGVLCPNTYRVTANTPKLAMTIGAQWDGMTRSAKRFFIGSVDECAVYPFALSSSRILALSDIEYGMNELLTGSGTTYSLIEQLSVSDDSSTVTEVSVSSDGLILSESFTYSIASNNVAGYKTLGSDQFNRLVSGTLGTATDGNSWSAQSGTSTLSVDGNEGQSTGDTSTNILFLGGSSSLEDISCMFKISDTTSTFGVIAFGTNASNYYSVRVGANLQLYKTVTGASTTIGTGAAFTLSANTWYHLHLKVNEGGLYGNVWIDGSTEPVSWMVTASDTTLSSGSTGLYIKGANAGTVFTFDNFFAIDNALSDFIYLQESYIFTSILPPLVDVIPAIIDASITETSLNWSDTTLAGSEFITPIVNAMGVDFLRFTASVEGWSIAYLPTEQMTEQEILATPVIIDLPADAALPLSDLITPFITPVPVDQISPTDSIAEAYTANLTDTPTLVDASTITQIRNLVDSDPSKRYIIRAFGGLIIIRKNTPLIASDKFVPDDHQADTGTLTTSDSVTHGPAYILTDNMNIAEAALFAINETIPIDSTASPTDTVISTIIPSPVDQLTEQEIIIFAVGPILPSDLTGSVIEEDVTLLLSDIFDPEAVTSDDSATIENVTFAPEEDVTLPDDVQSYSVTFAPTESNTVQEIVTFENVTFESNTVQVSDNSTVYRVTPVPVESNTVQEIVTLLLSDNFAADTPLETEVLLSIVTDTFDVYTSVPSDTVQSVTLNLEETDFAEQEIVTPLVLQSNTDALSVAETTLSTDAQTALDNLSIASEVNNIIVDFEDEDVILLESDFIFTVEAVAVTDLVSTSESLIQIETFIYALPDISLPNPVEVGTFTVNSVPIDTLNFTELLSKILSLAFDADNASSSDTLIETISTSFTGWLDLLFLAELVAYTVNSVPVEQENETESYFFASSDTYQDDSTPNTESNTVIVTVQESEQLQQIESNTVTLALPVTEQNIVTDASRVTVVLLGDIPLLLSESYTCYSEIVTLESNTVQDVTQFTGVQSNTVTPVPVTESDTVTSEIVTLEGVTLQDVTQLSVTLSDNSNDVTILESNIFDPEIVTLEGVTFQDKVTILYTVTMSDISVLTDASTTTSVTLSSDTLQPSENVLYSTIMAPVEAQTLREGIASTLIHAETDSVDIEELLSGIGYGLLDGSLNIVEVSSVSSASYIKTFGVVRTGNVDGVIRLGASTGIVRRGTADGVIS